LTSTQSRRENTPSGVVFPVAASFKVPRRHFDRITQPVNFRDQGRHVANRALTKPSPAMPESYARKPLRIALIGALCLCFHVCHDTTMMFP
jgi:hypothetical protein